MDPSSKFLKLLSYAKNDLGTQRCYLGPSFFMQSDLVIDPIKIGNCVSITLSTSESILCKAYMRQDLCDQYISLDNTVTSCQDIWKSLKIPQYVGQSVKCGDVQNLKVKKAYSVTIDIVVNGKNPDFNKLHRLHCLKQYIIGYYVIENSAIHFPNLNDDYLHLKSVYVKNVTGIQESPICNKVTAYIIGESTKINVDVVIDEEFCLQISKHTEEIFGYDHIYDKLYSYVLYPNLFKSCQKQGNILSNGILLNGMSGVGKTTLVRSFCSKYKVYLIEVNGTYLLKSDPGDSEKGLREVFELAELHNRNYPCILFFDQIENICADRSKMRSHSSRLVSQMLTLLAGIKKRNSLTVIGATKNINLIDSALRRPSRFNIELTMTLPNQDQRYIILKKLFSNSNSFIDFNKLSLQTRGYTGADLELMWRNSMHDAFGRCEGDTDNFIIQGTDVMNALKRKPSYQINSSFIIETHPVKWSDIGGLNNVKAKLKQTLEWPLLHGHAFHRLGVKKPSGILLFGPPGCCKTMLVKAAATACNVSFISASSAHIYSPYVGDSEKAVVEAFQQARNCMPCILFIDEIDSLVGARSNNNMNVQQRILSTFLNEMDGIGTSIDEIPSHSFDDDDGLEKNVKLHNLKTNLCEEGILIIAATNRPDLIDDALLRPGRFDRIIYVPPPNINERKDILKIILNSTPKNQINFDILAEKTENFSGADLVGLCREACLHAMEANINSALVTETDFEYVLNVIKPSITKSQLKFYKKFNEEHEYVIK
ncbi:Spermatogenesis-associated protein 5-like protein 1 [Nymphon striatum]|nr:Spermatogenesis-associated protein 5-like protein 1 [Nymphon striatum]